MNLIRDKTSVTITTTGNKSYSYNYAVFPRASSIFLKLISDKYFALSVVTFQGNKKTTVTTVSYFKPFQGPHAPTG